MNDVLSRWNRATVDDIAAAIVGGGTPSRDVPSYWGGDIAWATPGELTNLKGKYLTETIDTITRAGLAGSSARALPRNALLVTTRATLGLTALSVGPMSTNQGFKSIVFKGAAHADFYYHLFTTLKPELERRASGTTFWEISGRQFGEIEVPLPPIVEQRRIAAILDTLDGQIRDTERIIGKLRAARTALITTKFHVDKNGRWGDDWPLLPLGALVSGIDAGKSPDCPDVPASPGQWGVLKVSAVGSDHFRPLENKMIPSGIRADPRSAVRSGDVLVTRANTPDLVGMACMVDRSFDSRLVLCDKTWRINVNARLDRDFLVDVLRALPSRRYIQNLATGTSGSMKNFSQKALLRMPVPVPELTEQRRSAGRIAALTARVDTEIGALDKLRELKVGLMADLLTGRVRVPEGSTS